MQTLIMSFRALPTRIHSYVVIHNPCTLDSIELVKQVVLNGHKNFTNHCPVRVDVSHPIHWRLAILHTARVLLESLHRVLKILQAICKNEYKHHVFEHGLSMYVQHSSVPANTSWEA